MVVPSVGRERYVGAASAVLAAAVPAVVLLVWWGWLGEWAPVSTAAAVGGSSLEPAAVRAVSHANGRHLAGNAVSVFAYGLVLAALQSGRHAAAKSGLLFGVNVLVYTAYPWVVGASVLSSALFANAACVLGDAVIGAYGDDAPGPSREALVLYALVILQQTGQTAFDLAVVAGWVSVADPGPFAHLVAVPAGYSRDSSEVHLLGALAGLAAFALERGVVAGARSVFGVGTETG